MIFVWSTRLRPASSAMVRVCCRTLTTSSDERISRRSVLVVGIKLPQTTLDQRHTSFDIQRRLDAGKRKAEFDERDRDRRPHAHDYSVGIENARHRSDVVEHPA